MTRTIRRQRAGTRRSGARAAAQNGLASDYAAYFGAFRPGWSPEVLARHARHCKKARGTCRWIRSLAQLRRAHRLAVEIPQNRVADRMPQDDATSFARRHYAARYLHTGRRHADALPSPLIFASRRRLAGPPMTPHAG